MNTPRQGGTVVVSPPPFVHALSGAAGAVIAMALLYPLDQVRSMLQVDDELAKECAAPGGAGILGALSRIVRRHGKAGLWRGMVPVLVTMGVSNFVYFYCFTGMKAALLSRRRLKLRARGAMAGAAMATHATATAASAVAATAAKKTLSGGGAAVGNGVGLNPLESTLASSVAGVVNVLATTPLWVSNLRIKAGKGAGGLFGTLASIGRQEGLAGLWSGTAPSLVLVSNPIIQFVVYETLKQAARRRHNGGRHHGHHQHHHNAAVGVAEPLLCLPPAGNGSGGGPTGSGRGGGGVVLPVTALPSHEAFLLGAAAKAISTLVTYPLQLAQAKLRWGRGERGGEESSSPTTEDAPITREPTWLTDVAWQVLTCWSGTVDILVSVYRANGVGGMYQGMRAKLLHTVLTSALLFLGYERLVEVSTHRAAHQLPLPVVSCVLFMAPRGMGACLHPPDCATPPTQLRTLSLLPGG
ncbi:unnamed protein product [Scytosiphon promiscuus]